MRTATVELAVGRIAYREAGSGPVLVFVHGVGVNGDLWLPVAERLADAHRCILPDLPFGAHSLPLREGADLALPGMAAIVADLLEALDLREATVVANDTGGAVAQWVAGHRAERVARLVLTSCDAWDRFPPPTHRYLEYVARSRVALWLVAQALRLRAVQRLPIAYGWTTHRPMDPVLMRSFTRPIASIAAVRRDLRSLLLAVDRAHTHIAAAALPRFGKPALVAWGADDRLFPAADGRRLAELLEGRFTTVPGSRTFVPQDQPGLLAGLIRDFVART